MRLLSDRLVLLPFEERDARKTDNRLLGAVSLHNWRRGLMSEAVAAARPFCCTI
jgi:hypothetical protein